MPPVGLEPKISAGERPKTYALDRAASGIGNGRCVYAVNEHMGHRVVYNRKESIWEICVIT